MSKLRESIKKMHLREDTKRVYKTRYGDLTYYVSDFNTCRNVFEIVENILETGGCTIIDSGIEPVTDDIFDTHAYPSKSNGYIVFKNPDGEECNADIFGYYYDRDSIRSLSYHGDSIYDDTYWYTPGVVFDCSISSLGSDTEKTLRSVLDAYGYSLG